MAQPIQELETLPATLAAASDQLVGQYTAAEQALIAQSAAAVSAYVASAQTQADTAALYQRLQRAGQAVVTDLTRATAPLVRDAVTVAARNGSATALREVRQALSGHPALRDVYTRPTGEGVTAHGLHSANLIGQDLQSRLDATHLRITRFPADAYQRVVGAAAQAQVMGATPQQAQAKAWHGLADNGITGFTDTKGRAWNLSSYVEMATRTAVIRAYNDSHGDRMSSLGIDYFTVDTTGHPCALCIPWEGKVLTTTGGAGPALAPSAAGDGAVSFHVDATVDEARLAGLQHPNCKHVLVAFFPGVTQLRTRTPEEIEQGLAEYKQTQYLRALERAVRQAKTEQAAALNDVDAARAKRRVRDLQAQIRAFTDQTGLMRRPRREQLDLGNK